MENPFRFDGSLNACCCSTFCFIYCTKRWDEVRNSTNPIGTQWISTSVQQYQLSLSLLFVFSKDLMVQGILYFSKPLISSKNFHVSSWISSRSSLRYMIRNLSILKKLLAYVVRCSIASPSLNTDFKVESYVSNWWANIILLIFPPHDIVYLLISFVWTSALIMII